CGAACFSRVGHFEECCGRTGSAIWRKRGPAQTGARVSPRVSSRPASHMATLANPAKPRRQASQAGEITIPPTGPFHLWTATGHGRSSESVLKKTVMGDGRRPGRMKVGYPHGAPAPGTVAWLWYCESAKKLTWERSGTPHCCL